MSTEYRVLSTEYRDWEEKRKVALISEPMDHLFVEFSNSPLQNWRLPNFLTPYSVLGT
ncbi:hypothetical protein VB713_01615 [Anabaena cylindrica UHCC 0172]|uniref:hypothetical protein n=1 Tax=Anabaena cylindrica TaxID=1165 RepID=UPI002B1F53CB|nr:hypothetical protein [Anabaena cylindrica]MEA5549690.1 hypothetical protein [Anabaena cylindrica UHCC 0172]